MNEAENMDAQEAPILAISQADPEMEENKGFSVHLANFDGPFDLLLQLIARHKMDVTEVALGVVTDDFIAYIRALEGSEEGWDLDQTTEFLVVAATLLDLKAARLLPSGEIEDEGDLALLEARDLLFARLLQYRAFKQIASIFSERLSLEEKTFARVVALEAHFTQLLPEILIGVGADRFAAIAQRVLSPKVAPVVTIDHIHRPLVSVTEEAVRIVEHLRKSARLTFRNLVGDADSTLVVVARFLALLELYREGVLRFEQVIALGELHITWVGSGDGEVTVSDEFDIPVTPVEDETKEDGNV
jgi:segregation and condensation protein A